MKKLLLTLAVVSACYFTADAQTKKGVSILGGAVSFQGSSIKDTDTESSNFTFGPQYAYFVTDYVAIGGALGYSWSEDIDATVKSSSSTFSVVPFARLYDRKEGLLKFFGQLAVPMAWGSNKIDGEKTGDIASYGVALSPGFTLFPGKNIGIDFSVRGLYFNSESLTPAGGGDKTSGTNYGIDANSLAPSVGINFLF